MTAIAAESRRSLLQLRAREFKRIANLIERLLMATDRDWTTDEIRAHLRLQEQPRIIGQIIRYYAPRIRRVNAPRTSCASYAHEVWITTRGAAS